MKFVHISDTHNRHNKILIPDADVLICSGDFSSQGHESEVKQFFKWFARQKPLYKVIISGNHDKSFDPKFNDNKGKPQWLKDVLAEFTKLNNLHFYLENTGCEIEGVKIWGSPQSAWFHGERWAFNLERGAKAKAFYEGIPDDTDILITHGPAYNVLDKTYSDLYVGCEQLKKRIEEIQPAFHLFGHIHEAYGKETVNNTTFMNSAICTLQYEPINKPQIFEFSKVAQNEQPIAA